MGGTKHLAFLVFLLQISLILTSLTNNHEIETEEIVAVSEKIANQTIDMIFGLIDGTNGASIANAAKYVGEESRRFKSLLDNTIESLNQTIRSRIENVFNETIDKAVVKVVRTKEEIKNKFSNSKQDFLGTLAAKLQTLNIETASTASNSLNNFEDKLSILRENVSRIQVIQTKEPATSFTAFLRSDFVNGSGTVVIFDEVISNLGKGYDPKSGIFKVPRTGVYSVSSSFLVHGGYVNLQLMKNEVEVVRGYAAEDEFETSGFIHAVIELTTGDELWIQKIKGYCTGALRGNYYSSFSVTLFEMNDY